MKLSHRVQSLKPSSTLAVAARAKELRASGVDVLSFAAGEPDFDTPERIKRSAIAALEAGETKYAPAPGSPDARRAIAEKLRAENAIPEVTPEHVVISTGGKQSLYLVFQALLDPAPPDGEGWDVLLPTPAWVSYAPQVTLAGGRIVELPTTPETHFKLTPDQLRAALTPRSRILVLNSPSNPCGTMYSPDEIDALAKVVRDAAGATCPDLVVVTDEIYEKLIYGDCAHKSFASCEGVAERTVTVNGLSKAYAMTGWRIGYMAGSGDFGLRLAKGVARLQGQMTTSISTFCFPAIVTALTECADDVERMRRAFADRATLIHGALTSMPDLVCPRPTGAFYVFPDVSAHFGKAGPNGRKIESAATFAAELLDAQHVAVVPGEDFLGCGTNCVRFSFACSAEQIEQGMQRVGEFLGSLRQDGSH